MRADFGKLNTLANFLDDLPSSHFHMGVWFQDQSPCGTACCIYGWSAIIFNKGEWLRDPTPGARPRNRHDGGHVRGFSHFFGVPFEETEELLWCLWGDHDEDDIRRFSKVTPQEAARAVRDVITRLGGTVELDRPWPKDLSFLKEVAAG